MAAKMSTNGETLKFRAAKLKGFTVLPSNIKLTWEKDNLLFDCKFY